MRQVTDTYNVYKFDELTKEAREQAIEWQDWQSKQNLSYDEILEWQSYFESIAKEYDLTEEFEENGII